MKFIIRTKSGSSGVPLYYKDVGMGTTSVREEAHVYDSGEIRAPFIKHANQCGFVVVPVEVP